MCLWCVPKTGTKKAIIHDVLKDQGEVGCMQEICSLGPFSKSEFGSLWPPPPSLAKDQTSYGIF